MPAGHGVRSDQIEALFPVGPELAKGNPEQFVEQTQSRLRMPAFQDDELPAKREVLQHQVLARTKKAKDGSEPDPEKVEHSGKVIADEVLVRPPMLLISKPDGIVANDTSSGFASSRSKSANLPCSTVPRRSNMPRNFAAL